MIFAPRGVGKTWVALSIADAAGSEFLGWKAPRPRRVLYLDSEMPASMLRDRYASVVTASRTDVAPENFGLVAADFQPDGLPDLSDIDAQRFYERVIADADLIVVDNLSTIARGLRENEADSFAPVQSWLLAQRAAGRSVLYPFRLFERGELKADRAGLHLIQSAAGSGRRRPGSPRRPGSLHRCRTICASARRRNKRIVTIDHASSLSVIQYVCNVSTVRMRQRPEAGELGAIIITVTMLICHALEQRCHWFIFAFAAACAFGFGLWVRARRVAFWSCLRQSGLWWREKCL